MRARRVRGRHATARRPGHRLCTQLHRRSSPGARSRPAGGAFAGEAGTTAVPADSGKVRRANLHRAARPHLLRSLAEVRESGRPAFFFDYDESLVYWDDELSDIRDLGDALQTGANPTPLPPAVLENAVGIEYGWQRTRLRLSPLSPSVVTLRREYACGPSVAVCGPASPTRHPRATEAPSQAVTEGSIPAQDGSASLRPVNHRPTVRDRPNRPVLRPRRGARATHR